MAVLTTTRPPVYCPKTSCPYQQPDADFKNGYCCTMSIRNGRFYEQLLRSSRRNVSPVELIDGPFVMCHEHLAGTLVERREIASTPSRANGVLHYPPEAFDRIEMMATMGG